MQTKTALVVDDSRVARMTLGKLLRSHGFEIIEQHSAEAALQWLRETASLPTLIFMDVMMDGMDGFTATQQIKAEANWRNLPIVVCSGKETAADLEQARASGATAVLSKPPAAEALQQILDEVLTAQEPIPGAAAQSGVRSTENELSVFRAALLSELEQKLDATLSSWRQQLEKQQENTQQQLSTELLSRLSQQLDEISRQRFDQLDRQLSARTAQQVSEAVRQIDFSELETKLKGALQSESQHWLQQQQSRLQNELQASLRQRLFAEIEADLQQQVRMWASEQMAQQGKALNEEAEQQQRVMDSLQSQLAMQRNILVVTGIVALLALGLALL
ncbi:MAG: hypothetical protein Kow0083_14980 [Methylophaga sp.]